MQKTNLKRLSLFATVLMLSSLALSFILSPSNLLIPTQPNLEEIVPTNFGDWKEVKSNLIQAGLTTNAGEDRNMDNPYDQVLMRTYEDSKGHRVMLALAWGQKQQQEVKIHRPELCYSAQGYVVNQSKEYRFGIISENNQEVQGKVMIASQGNLQEVVSYWIRIGRIYSQNALETRLYILKSGLMGDIPDGILVRVSNYMGNSNLESSIQLNQSFINMLLTNIDSKYKKLLIM